MGWVTRWIARHGAGRWGNYRGGGERVQPGSSISFAASQRVPYVARHSSSGGPSSTEVVEDDATELLALAQIQAKRDAESRVSVQQWWGMNRFMAGHPTVAIASPTSNGTPAASDVPDVSSFRSAAGALVNRSPTTSNHNHYYPAPSIGPTVIEPPAQPKEPNPWPWIFATVLVASLLLGGLLYWLATRTPAVVPNTGQYGLGLDDLKVY